MHNHAKRGQWSRTYRAWRYMRDRCRRDPNYKGITWCKRWDSFENFLADMGEQPEGKTLDRINCAKVYSKATCRWATRIEQARNKTTNVTYMYRGKRRTLPEIAELTGIAHKTLVSRIKLYGWTFADAVSKPIRKYTPWR